MGLFNKVAAAAKTTEPKSKKKATTWVAGGDDTVAKAVHELTALNAQAKAIDAKMGLYKTVVQKYALDNFLKDYASLGIPPETPMQIQNHDGEKVTFVVQDRSGQAVVKDDQVEALTDLLGADAAANIVYEETSFGFNRDVLALPGVQEVVEKALERTFEKLVKDEILTEEQVGELLDVKQKRAFKPGTMDRIAQICGSDTTKMRQFLEVVGSACVKYVKC